MPVNTVWSNPKFQAGWKSFEKLLRMKLNEMKKVPHEGEGYNWGHLFEDSLGELERMKPSRLTSEVFDTHRTIIVRIFLPSFAAGCKPSIKIGRNHIVVSGIPGKAEEKISLPARVSSRSGKAELSGSILEVRLRKKQFPKSFKTVKVSAERSS